MQYPHAIEHGGSLWIVYATNKQSIEITELPLAKMNLVEVAVYGGTPGGVAAAIAAARAGRSVALLEYHKHIGGMTTSGLGKSDIETKEAIGGLFREFTSKVKAYYVERYGASHDNVKKSGDGYYYEPSVAQRVIDRMVADERRISVRTHVSLDGVIQDGARVAGLRVKDRSTGEVTVLHAAVVIDGAYEGDVFAAAGAAYRVGREGRSEFNEKHAGVIYQNYDTREVTAGSTGAGDKRIPAYTYRLCMTADPSNAAPLLAPPAGYDRTRYHGYLDDWKAGRLDAPKTMKDGVGYYGPTFGTLVRAVFRRDSERQVRRQHETAAAGVSVRRDQLQVPGRERSRTRTDRGFDSRSDSRLGLFFAERRCRAGGAPAACAALSPRQRRVRRQRELPVSALCSRGAKAGGSLHVDRERYGIAGGAGTHAHL
ncbi:MAG: FAD-dependent oxidoreductase [Acidobacteria bacterium]|nr:FAD-dependent oxidoreductase [Acidobacteriota bacterium]